MSLWQKSVFLDAFYHACTLWYNFLVTLAFVAQWIEQIRPKDEM